MQPHKKWVLRIKRLKTGFLPRCLVAAPNILRETGFFFVSPIAVLKRGEVWGQVLCPMPYARRVPHVTEKGYIFKCQPRERLQHPFLKLYREGNQFAAESPSPEPFLIKLFLRQEVDSLEARE